MKIVKGKDPLGDDFPGPEAVAQERAGESGNVGVGFLREWTGIKFEGLVLDVNGAIGREGLSVAGAAGGVDTIEHVDTLANHFEKLGGGAEAHGVAWLVSREKGFGVLNGGEHFILRFSHGNSTNGVAIEVKVNQLPRGQFAEVGINASLNDAEVELAALPTGGLIRFNPILAPFSPSGGESGGLFGVFPFARIGRAFIKEHRDVRTKDGLNLHALLRAEHHAGAVEVALKLHSLFGDLADFGKRPDLEASGVGEHGTVPGGERMEASQFIDDLGPGAEPKVVSVSKNDLRLHEVKIIRVKGFHRSLGADRHKYGGFDRSVRRGETTAAGFAIGIVGKKFKHEWIDRSGVSAGRGK